MTRTKGLAAAFYLTAVLVGAAIARPGPWLVLLLVLVILFAAATVILEHEPAVPSGRSDPAQRFRVDRTAAAGQFDH